MRKDIAVQRQTGHVHYGACNVLRVKHWLGFDGAIGLGSAIGTFAAHLGSSIACGRRMSVLKALSVNGR